MKYTKFADIPENARVVVHTDGARVTTFQNFRSTFNTNWWETGSGRTTEDNIAKEFDDIGSYEVLVKYPRKTIADLVQAHHVMMGTHVTAFYVPFKTALHEEVILAKYINGVWWCSEFNKPVALEDIDFPGADLDKFVVLSERKR